MNQQENNNAMDTFYLTVDKTKYSTHMKYAFKHQSEAVKLHEEGKHDKAAMSTLISHGHYKLASQK